jgi:hypothetical protein
VPGLSQTFDFVMSSKDHLDVQGEPQTAFMRHDLRDRCLELLLAFFYQLVNLLWVLL